MAQGIAFKVDATFADVGLPVLPPSIGVSGVRSRFIAGSQITTGGDGETVQSWTSIQGDKLTPASGRGGGTVSAVAGGGKTTPVVFFGGSTQAMSVPQAASRPHTVAFMIYLSQLPTEQRYFIGGSGAQIGINEHGFIVNSGSSGVFGSAPVTPGWNVGVVSFNTDTTVGRFNGTTTTRTLGTSNRTELTLGTSASTDSSTQVGIHMYVRELLTWDRALSSAELTTVEADLRASIA